MEEFLSYPNFTRNKYFVWYSNIVERASHRTSHDSSTHELHHALPKSMGGTQMVSLSHKEHYICHWLLTKFTTGIDHHKMIIAMSYFYYFKINTKATRPLNAQKSRAYANYKVKFVESMREYYSDPTKNYFYKDEEFVFRHIDTGEVVKCDRYTMGKKIPATEVSRLITRSNKGLKVSSSGWDIWVNDLQIFSSEIKPKPNMSMKRSVTCPHCDKVANTGNYARWHGDNCKLKTSTIPA